MIIDLIVGAFTAFTAVAVLFAVFRLFKRKPPKGAIPGIAALAIVGITATVQYGWADRMIGGLTGMVVIDRVAEPTPFIPWSYVYPITEHLAVFDRPAMQTNEAHPDLRMGRILFLHRQDETQEMTVVIDCANHRHTAITPDATFTADGLPENADWQTTTLPNLYEAACPQ